MSAADRSAPLLSSAPDHISISCQDPAMLPGDAGNFKRRGRIVYHATLAFLVVSLVAGCILLIRSFFLHNSYHVDRHVLSVVGVALLPLGLYLARFRIYCSYLSPNPAAHCLLVQKQLQDYLLLIQHDGNNHSVDKSALLESLGLKSVEESLNDEVILRRKGVAIYRSTIDVSTVIFIYGSILLTLPLFVDGNNNYRPLGIVVGLGCVLISSVLYLCRGRLYHSYLCPEKPMLDPKFEVQMKEYLSSLHQVAKGKLPIPTPQMVKLKF